VEGTVSARRQRRQRRSSPAPVPPRLPMTAHCFLLGDSYAPIRSALCTAPHTPRAVGRPISADLVGYLFFVLFSFFLFFFLFSFLCFLFPFFFLAYFSFSSATFLKMFRFDFFIQILKCIQITNLLKFLKFV
jgi:hypothetical protein